MLVLYHHRGKQPQQLDAMQILVVRNKQHPEYIDAVDLVLQNGVECHLLQGTVELLSGYHVVASYYITAGSSYIDSYPMTHFHSTQVHQ